MTDAAKSFVTEKAYDPSYGARPLKRFVQKHVETMSARLILEDRLNPHDVIRFDAVDGELVAEAINGEGAGV